MQTDTDGGPTSMPPTDRFTAWPAVVLLSFFSACAESPTPPTATEETATGVESGSPPETAAFVPNDRRVLLIVGQDLGSVREYSLSDCCPEPAGVTTYIGLYKVLDERHSYGGMGIDPEGRPLEELADWGAGPSSLYALMQEYPRSAIAVGLSLVENEHPGAMGPLIEGKYDDAIRHLAGLLGKHPQPVYLRVGYEFDGMWNQGYGNRQQYIDAYRRVVDVIRAEKVDNVAFVWQGSSSPTDDSIEGGHENISEWYPGDEYVDWMGLSWFLVPDFVGPTSSVQVTQNQLADELLEFARAHKKPVMIAESTPLAYDLTQKYKANHSPVWDGVAHENKVPKTDQELWDEWFAPYFAYVHANRDVIRAVAYINAHWDAQTMWSANDYASGYWGDSRVQQNPYVLEQWLEETGGPAWVHTTSQLQEAFGDGAVR